MTPTIPKSHPVQPLKPGQPAQDRATCGTCRLSWDDAISTELTPVPAGRCPFEYFHVAPRDNPNENCLEGMRCPKCGSYAPFKIIVTTCVTMYDDGTEDYDGADYDDSAPCECAECGHAATVGAFRT